MNFAELIPEERLVAEQAVLNLRTLNSAADAAADGTVFAVAEKLAVEQGRELTRKTLQATLNVQVKDVEKKVGPLVEIRLQRHLFTSLWQGSDR